jgi:ATP-binding cassette subfamily B protein
MAHRYTVVRQVDGSDCGAAALATVALHHGLALGLQQVRELAYTDRRGATLLDLLRGAETLGFSAMGVRAEFEHLAQIPLPAIAHSKASDDTGHYVVVHRVRGNRVLVADPRHGLETLSREEFLKRWSGHLLVLVPGSNTVPPESSGKRLRPVLRFLRVLRPHLPILGEAALCAVLISTLGVSTSYFVQHLVDSILVRNEGKLLNALGIGMVIIVFFRVLFGIVRDYLLAHISRRIDLTLISGYVRHILGLPLAFFEMRRVGEIFSRVNDTVKIREAISGAASTAAMDGTLVVFLLAVLWVYDLPLALVATAFAPLLVCSVLLHHPASVRRTLDAMEMGEQLSSHLIETIEGAETVKAFGAERMRAQGGEIRLARVVQAVFGLQKLSMSTQALGTLLTATAGIAILWYGGHRVMQGALTVGQLLFFYSLVTYLMEPLHRLSTVNLKIQDALSAVNRLYQIMDLEREATSAPRKIQFATVHEAIELQNLSFRYGSRENVLTRVNLRIPSGKTIAIVGESGSGKSTLIKLLLGFYPPTEGRILIDGVDLSDFDLTSLRGRIGVVTQHPFLFSKTIWENISFGRPDARFEEVVEAAREAGLDQFIAGLPERYETMIGERGVNLSGGERQRLAIARALLCQPEILIFDEATSHLDSATERAIQKNLRTVFRGKTAVLVAHRLSTIRDADTIYVLHRGRVLEHGTCAELMAASGRFAALWHAQMDGAEIPWETFADKAIVPPRGDGDDSSPLATHHAPLTSPTDKELVSPENSGDGSLPLTTHHAPLTTPTEGARHA